VKSELNDWLAVPNGQTANRTALAQINGTIIFLIVSCFWPERIEGILGIRYATLQMISGSGMPHRTG
jgi:hypothetical protein